MRAEGKVTGRLEYSEISFQYSEVLGGCATDPNRVAITNQNHPGPALGQAVGSGVGAMGGNVVGGVVGFGEGVAVGSKAPFNNTTRIVRR